MIRLMTSLCLVVWLSVPGVSQDRADTVLAVWPQSPPAWVAPDQAERDTSGDDGRMVAGKRVIRLGFVSTPECHVYRAKDTAADTVVLICPGGGYNILAWDLEGTEIAHWLQRIGVDAVVLKYRVPTSDQGDKWLPPVQDIQRALSLIRDGGIEGLKPTRIGVLGFSAGGNAAARAATAPKRFYDPVDSHDQAACHADFAVLIYPAWLVEADDVSRLIDDLPVGPESPPMFFAHAFDDRVTCMSSVTLFSELKRHGVPASLHVFASGGHGFGARPAEQPTDAWPNLCETWMRHQGYLE